jgi:hypothetical protein
MACCQKRAKERPRLPALGVFLDNGFDPATDLKRNGYGVPEFAGNKPNLERDSDPYQRARGRRGYPT